MADTKVSAMTNVATVAGTTEWHVSEAGADKALDVDTLVTYLQQSAGLPRVKCLTSQHAISSATATEVTGLTMALEIGTYVFEYTIIEQTDTITVAPLYGLNFDGTATGARWWFEYADLSATLLAAIGTVAHDTSTATLGFLMAKAEDDFATTTPNMHPSATTNAVQTVDVDLMVKIRGWIEVSVAGNLELWHGSETATPTQVEVGSSLVVIRTA